MKLVKILLASSLAFAAATTFAASAHEKVQPQSSEKVVVSTQELPESTSPEAAAAQPNSAQPTTESAAEASTTTPAQPTVQ